MRKTVVLIVLLALLTALAASTAACGGGEPEQKALTAADVAGRYVQTSNRGGPALAGPYIIFRADGTYELHGVSAQITDLGAIEGPYTISGTDLTLIDEVAAKQIKVLRVDGTTLREDDGTTWEKQAE